MRAGRVGAETDLNLFLPTYPKLYTQYDWVSAFSSHHHRRYQLSAVITRIEGCEEQVGGTESFLANVNVLRYVCYMRSQFRLSSVCLSVCRLLSVTLVHPTQAVKLFGNFFHHTIAQGLYFFGAKNRWWGTPLSP